MITWSGCTYTLAFPVAVTERVAWADRTVAVTKRTRAVLIMAEPPVSHYGEEGRQINDNGSACLGGQSCAPRNGWRSAISPMRPLSLRSTFARRGGRFWPRPGWPYSLG